MIGVVSKRIFKFALTSFNAVLVLPLRANKSVAGLNIMFTTCLNSCSIWLTDISYSKH